MLKCRDVVEQASAYLEQEVSIGRRLAIRVHLFLCGPCRDFVAGLQRSLSLVQRYADTPAAIPQGYLDRIEQAALAASGSAGALAEERGAGGESRGSATQPDRPERKPRLEVIEGYGGDERVSRVFREIEEALGSVPNLYRTYAHHPQVLESTWDRVKAIMLAGNLPRQLKESIAVVVSHDNGCGYCVDYHADTLRSLGVSDDEIRRLLGDPLAGRFAPKERALLALARQANRDPHGASDEQVDLARRAGASEAEIIEALAVMELFTSVNRFVDTLHIPSDQRRVGE